MPILVFLRSLVNIYYCFIDYNNYKGGSLYMIYNYGFGAIAGLFIWFLILFVSMLPLYFCIKWAIKKAIKETVSEQYLK